MSNLRVLDTLEMKSSVTLHLYFGWSIWSIPEQRIMDSSLQLDIHPHPDFLILIFFPQIFNVPSPLPHSIFFPTALILPSPFPNFKLFPSRLEKVEQGTLYNPARNPWEYRQDLFCLQIYSCRFAKFTKNVDQHKH